MDDEYLGWNFTPIEQWSQFLGDCNWYTFHPIKVEYEHDATLGGRELTLIFMGLGFCVRHNYAVTETLRKIRRDAEEIYRMAADDMDNENDQS